MPEVDHQVLFKFHLQDISEKGGCVHFACHIYPVSLWLGLEILGPSCLATAAAAAVVPMTTTMTLPALTQAEELETAAQCT